MHEVWGGLDSGAEAELDALAARAEASGDDGTDYSASQVTGAFRTFWSQRMGITMLTSIGEMLNKAARSMELTGPAATTAAATATQPAAAAVAQAARPAAAPAAAATALATAGTAAACTCSRPPAPSSLPLHAGQALATPPQGGHSQSVPSRRFVGGALWLGGGGTSG